VNSASSAGLPTSSEENSVTCDRPSRPRFEHRSRIPSSASTTASTSFHAPKPSQRGTGENSPPLLLRGPSRPPIWFGRFVTFRGVPSTRTPARPCTVTSPSSTSAYPVSSQDGASRARYGGRGRSSDPVKPNPTEVPAGRSRSNCHSRAPSLPIAQAPSASSARNRRPGATDRAHAASSPLGVKSEDGPGSPRTQGGVGGSADRTATIASMTGSVPRTVPDSVSLVQSAR
jgi:hypothetical protein